MNDSVLYRSQIGLETVHRPKTNGRLGWVERDQEHWTEVQVTAGAFFCCAISAQRSITLLYYNSKVTEVRLAISVTNERLTLQVDAEKNPHSPM